MPIVRANAATHRRRRAPAPRDPIALEHELGVALTALARRAIDRFATTVRGLPSMVERGDARANDMAEAGLRAAEVALRDAQPIARAFAPRVGAWNEAELGRQLRAMLGADIVLPRVDGRRYLDFAAGVERQMRRALRDLASQVDRHVGIMLAAVRQAGRSQLKDVAPFHVERADAEFPIEHALQHVRMISGLTKEERATLAQELALAHAEGRLTRRTVEKILLARYAMAEKRAKLVARDQVAKLNGQVDMDRQVAIGVTHFQWICRHDNKVRPLHKRRRDKIYEWADPPLTNGVPSIPGSDPLCRCKAKALVDNIAAILGGRARAPGAREAPQTLIASTGAPPRTSVKRAAAPAGFDAGRARVLRAPGDGVPAKLSPGALYRVDPDAIRDRLIALDGGGRDRNRMGNVRLGYEKGKLPPVKLFILPDGRLYVDDGRHRLLIALEQGRDVLAKFARVPNNSIAAGTVPLSPRK